MRTSVTRYTSAIPFVESAGRSSTARSVSCLMNDEDRLVSQLRAREEGVFEAIVTRHQEPLIRMAMRHVANRATAEEVVQETWIAVMRGVNQFEGRSSLYAWICAILIHKAKDRSIREKRQRTFSDFKPEIFDWNGESDRSGCKPRGEWFGPEGFSRLLGDDRTPEKLLASRQATACMWQAIETLPILQKEVLILSDVHGIQPQKVCQQLKISITNFYVRLHRARKRVKAAVTAALG